MTEDFIRQEQRILHHPVTLQKHHEIKALKHIERQLNLWNRSLNNYPQFQEIYGHDFLTSNDNEEITEPNEMFNFEKVKFF